MFMLLFFVVVVAFIVVFIVFIAVFVVVVIFIVIVFVVVFDVHAAIFGFPTVFLTADVESSKGNTRRTWPVGQ